MFPISKYAPFLSNLNIIDNITLVLEQKHHFLHSGYKDKARRQLAKFLLEDIALKHHTKVSENAYFIAQLIRASLDEDKHIIMDSPFSIISLGHNIDLLDTMIEKLGIDRQKMVIIDYESEENTYKEELCHIVKCS